MKPDFLYHNENSNAQSSQKFEEADPIMTENLNGMEQYLLVEFGSGGRIDYRDVVFWSATMKNGILKIILYDLGNKVVITKMYDTERPDKYSSWFLISQDYFDGEVVKFQ